MFLTKLALPCLGLSFILTLSSVFAQKKDNQQTVDGMSLKFGSITAKDFDPALHSFDTTADAVVLFDKGYSYFRESSDGWFQLIFEKHKRIKVLNKNGLDAANFIIGQYRNSRDEERIDKLKGVTYNLDGGNVVATKLDGKDIYKDQVSANLIHTKFGLPAVKEGSIIEVSYTIISDFLFNLQGWEFQGRFPRLYSEYIAKIPEFFVYVNSAHGYINLEKSVTTNSMTFNLRERSESGGGGMRLNSLSGTETQTKWVARKVPGMKEEPFTTTVDNHISKIEFQLKEYRFPNQLPQPVLSSWEKVSEGLMQEESFGAAFSRNNGWLDDDVKSITANATTDLDKAKALYTYIRDKFNLTKQGGKYMTDLPKNVWKNMKGNTADANLMLALVLRHAGMDAHPLLISTRDNGYANELYPLINEYNYVAVKLNLGGKKYYLDATNPLLGFGHLPIECYNGHARVITKMPLADYLQADSLKENKTTIINLFGDPEKPFTGQVKSRLGYYESFFLRERLKQEGMEKVASGIKNALPSETELSNLVIEDEKNYDESAKVGYFVQMDNLKDEDIIYINPLLGEKTKENPFSAANRMYPVEMPYAFKETIISNIKIPDGYELDEMPRSSRVKLDDGFGQFDYVIQHQDGMIQLRTITELKKANFNAEDYQTLREFFIYIVNKQAEQIVLKKKS